MEVQTHVSLKPFNTFGLGARAAFFAEVRQVADLQAVLQDSRFHDMPRLVLGGGSNLLFTRDFEGLVIKVSIKGIEARPFNDEHVLVKVGAGENWHELVLHTIEQGWQGLENLSLIPGTAGAAPVQNIGAYGVELTELFQELEAVAIESGQPRTFRHAELQFAYRNSVFKNELKGRYIITSVTLRLRRRPVFNTSYGAIKQVLDEMGVTELSADVISRAVISIRQSKLPDPAKIGNCGSFFKNPLVPEAHYQKLKTASPDIPGYPAGKGQVKVPAGWLIERCGFKGKRVGNVGMHSKQALVMVNHGNATGAEARQLAEMVQQAVQQQFGIALEPEVNMI